MDLVERPEHVAVRHPWEEARFAFFAGVLARELGAERPLSVLDVGAGDAWFAEQLTTRLPVRRIVCWDTGYTPEFLASQPAPAGGALQLSRERPVGTFDLLLLLDVLEHVEDDRGFLAELVRESLAPGGHVLMSVPAWPQLFSSHDERLRHYRRYAPAAARRVLASAGLEVLRSAGLFHSLLVPRAVQVAGERLTGRPRPPAHLGEWNAPPVVTGLVRGALACEGLLSSAQARLGWSLPGLSWWALCRKQPDRGCR
jgi:trans-aconitate methyltransferase